MKNQKNKNNNNNKYVAILHNQHTDTNIVLYFNSSLNNMYSGEQKYTNTS